ncbi:MAG: hypothetical protein H0U87_06260 [Acidobacteria bacterium]|nr:hypothetical protein [Acidobacteriota bacterium]
MSVARPTQFQVEMLCRMMAYAFTEIRMLGWENNAERAADLADAFHNLPILLFDDEFDWDFFRNSYLKEYENKHSKSSFDYVAMLDKIKLGENPFAPKT